MYKDESEVPEYWICTMNDDPKNNVCGVGGENHSAPANVNLKYKRGDLVWGKLKGYPWWPGRLTKFQEREETFWVDLINTVFRFFCGQWDFK